MAKDFSILFDSSMYLNRFMGGIAVNRIPPKYGSSVLSRVRYAFPPRGCLEERVRSLYMTPSDSDTCW